MHIETGKGDIEWSPGEAGHEVPAGPTLEVELPNSPSNDACWHNMQGCQMESWYVGFLGFLDGSGSKESACNVVRSLGWEDPLEEGMATHSSILAWRIPMDR